jgi:hypothetical protein
MELMDKILVTYWGGYVFTYVLTTIWTVNDKYYHRIDKPAAFISGAMMCLIWPYILIATAWMSDLRVAVWLSVKYFSIWRFSQIKVAINRYFR